MNQKIWVWISVLVAAVLLCPVIFYNEICVNVPSKHMAIFIHKVGKDIPGNEILAPSPEYKGVQRELLTDSRTYRNPLAWDWRILPQIEIPENKFGVRIRLYGEDLLPGELIAWKESQKGIVPEVLREARYAINAVMSTEFQVGAANPKFAVRQDYAEIIELHDPIVIPVGWKGLVVNLCGPMPAKPNQLLSGKGERGVQEDTLDPGTYYINPYVQSIRLVDCRSQRYNLEDIGFPSKDGFWVRMGGIIEFRNNPDKAATTYCLFNEERDGVALDQAVINKVVLPNARAYTRLTGSDHSGKEFITGTTRAEFQEGFQKQMRLTCEAQGVEIIQALTTTIKPPDQIATPVRQRQVALQKQGQFTKELAQQEAEQELEIAKATVLQKKAVVDAEKLVVAVTTEAVKKQEVEIIDAKMRLAVAENKLKAAQAQASAITAKGKAAADVIKFGNEAEAAGWQKSIQAFGGQGNEFARFTLYKKLGPSFKSMMVNTNDSPLMDGFKMFDQSRLPFPVVAPKN